MSEAPKMDALAKEIAARLLTPSPELFEGLAQRAAELATERLASEREPWIGVEEAAQHLACGRSRLYALTSADRIPFERDGSRLLFRRSALDAWLANGGAKRP
jgi:excisionase family DNA binding protein